MNEKTCWCPQCDKPVSEHEAEKAEITDNFDYCPECGHCLEG